MQPALLLYRLAREMGLTGGGQDPAIAAAVWKWFAFALLLGEHAQYDDPFTLGARMENAIQDQLAELGDAVRSAAIPSASKEKALWCVDKLPTLYAKFRMTYESRYGDEITRLVQGALHELVSSDAASPATHELAASMTERLRLLHEQSGIPELNLKLPRPAPPRTRKAKSS
jgi:hypothetical protein